MKAKIEIESTLNNAYTEFVGIKDLKQAKQFISDYIITTKVKDTDKKKMLYEINNSGSIVRLQFYVTNALLKYEGLGVC